MEEVLHQGKIAWVRDYDFPLESNYESVNVGNKDHSSPGIVARFFQRILPDSWMEKAAIGSVHSEVAFDPDRELDFEEGDGVELLLRKVEPWKNAMILASWLP